MCIDALLRQVRHPARYAGGEVNAHEPSVDARLRVAVAHPDVYEVATRDVHVERLYRRWAALPGVTAERVFLVAEDLERLLREHDLGAFTLESRSPAAAVDVLHVVLPDTPAVQNVPALLGQIGIAPLAAARSENAPLVVASGPFAATPNAIADLVDVIVRGEPEDAVAILADRWLAARAAGLDRIAALTEVARITDGAWVPALHEADGAPHTDGIEWPVPDAVALDLDRAFHPTAAIVPAVAPTEPEWCVEVSRATPDAPIRYRSAATVLDLVDAGLAATGFERVRLDGPAIERHPAFPELLRTLRRRLAADGAALAIPALGREAQLTVLPELRRTAPDRPMPFVLTPDAPLDLDAPPPDAVAWAEAAYRAGATSIEIDAPHGADPTRAAATARLARAISEARKAVDGRLGRVDLSLVAPGGPAPGYDALQAGVQAIRAELGKRRDVRITGQSPGHADILARLRCAPRTVAAALIALGDAGHRASALAFDRDGRDDWLALDEAIRTHRTADASA